MTSLLSRPARCGSRVCAFLVLVPVKAVDVTHSNQALLKGHQTVPAITVGFVLLMVVQLRAGLKVLVSF